MATDDIYKSKRVYSNLLRDLPTYVCSEKNHAGLYNNNTPYYTLLHLEDFKNTNSLHLTTPYYKNSKRKRKYEIKNPDNLIYFAHLENNFASRDLSYIRRMKYLRNLIAICNYTDKNLKDLERDDIDQILINIHKTYVSVESRKDIVKGIKYLWRILFPEKDEKGRIDDSITPYAVRHLSAKVDKSKQKNRGDRLDWKEFESLINYFQSDIRIQAYLMVATESLGRPQEILYTKINNLELKDNYAKLHIDEHGKEGTGFLQIIDSLPYLMKWLKEHPRKHDKDAWLFCNTAINKNCEQLTPVNINKKLRIACKHLDIDKPITCYSLKRNGVTFRRARGESDVEIQHIARWTSTKQIKTYDQTDSEDALKRQLARRGLIKDKNYEELLPKSKTCAFCGHLNPFHSDICDKCVRPLNSEKVKMAIQTQDIEMIAMRKSIELLQQELKVMQKHLALEKIK